MLRSIKCLRLGSRHNRCTFSSTTAFKSSSYQTLHQLLEKCRTMRELKQIHAQIILLGLNQQTLNLGKLVSFCAVSETGDLQYARFVFDKLPQRNRYMYNSLIRGYSNRNDPVKALFLYRQMICSGSLGNEFTYPFVLKACASTLRYMEGESVHVHVIKLGFGSIVCVQNALISFYCGCGFICHARKVFDDISDRSLVSWNSMIGGYSKIGCCGEAFLLFQEMIELGAEPDDFTFVSLLSVCSQNSEVRLGQLMHSYIVVNGVEIDIYVQNALVDMYAKCGQLHSAQAFFDRMSDKNVISWTSMISAYAKNGLVELAEEIFNQMPAKNVVSWNSMISCYIQEGFYSKAVGLFFEICKSGVAPDETTLVGILSACCQLGDLAMGKIIHEYIRSNYATPSLMMLNSLIDMYAKCGCIETSLCIFLQMPEKNIVSWNVMIGALALHGCGFKAVEVFESMEVGGIQPDEITFTGLLSACSHSGLVDLGKYHFDSMIHVYGVTPDIEHYACMIDLFGRVGLFGEAIKLIGSMPMKPDIVVWGALLGACRIHGNVEIGKQIIKQLLELEPYTSGVYVLVSNMFCEAGRWDDVKKIRKLIKNHGIMKNKATSSIEIDGRVHEFMVDDLKHETSSEVCVMLDHLMDRMKSSGSEFLDAEGIG